MSRESIASVLLIFLPLALTALAALAAWGTGAITRWIKDRRVALALEVIANGAAAIVADLAQHVVADLKDPSKPGSWSSVAAATVRVRAVERVKQLYPQAVALAQEALANPDRINDLLGTVVERAVVDLKSKAPAQLPAVETLPSLAADPVLLDRKTIVAPEPITPAGDNPERGSISLRALLAIVVGLAVVLPLGMALSGCPRNPPVSGCQPEAQTCIHDRPHVCSASQRWHAAGNLQCSAVGGVCTVLGGRAYCGPVADAGAADGGE